jgi:hypothetical protein
MIVFTLNTGMVHPAAQQRIEQREAWRSERRSLVAGPNARLWAETESKLHIGDVDNRGSSMVVTGGVRVALSTKQCCPLFLCRRLRTVF